MHFLRRKVAEYEALKQEIAELSREVDRLRDTQARPR